MAEAPPPEAPPPDATPPDDRYVGEGCVTLWLKFMIVLNVLAMVVATFFLSRSQIRAVAPHFSDEMYLLYNLGGILNIVFLTAMLRRRLWGYVGLWVVGIGAVALNIAAGMQVAQAVSNLMGLVLLYWVLQIGGERSGWSRLK